MNQIFSFHRFVLLIRLDISEKGKNYLLMGSLLTSLLILLTFPILLSKEHSEILYLLHPLALFMLVIFGGSLYTNTAFNQYSSPETGISALMIPASRLEKYLTALLTNLLFTIPFLLLFLKLHYFTIGLANKNIPADMLGYQPIPYPLLQYFISIHIIVQAAVFLGSIYFRKLSYIKTAGILLAAVTVIFFSNWVFAYSVTNHPTNIVTFPFSAWRIWYAHSGRSYYVDLPKNIQYAVYSFPVLFLLACWYIAFVRLQEKEI
ncbi:hypothetical protein DYBT9275_03293 [Dyadobacter sp. CECT 9275]|uniref:Uncharacterized protein n=1 Tax=Dyadobacter helix TaxID=2822344 RepID=A0A916N593_9BACT|nr:hypothetical protein [Dyadobacter sp. CECT 9275]CAG5004073.1 hypothetical protein DYBT9275_03293 [Dyadobacter sp. CECT 9275]